MKRFLVTIGLLLCVAAPASAQYKWVDSSGKIHYSDKPPPGNIQTEKLRPPPRPSVPAPGAAKDDPSKSGPKTLAEQEQAFRKRKAEGAKTQEEQAQKDNEARERAENCRRARAVVANLELGGRQTRIDEKGERVFLSDQEISQATARARQDAAAACN